LSLLGLPSSIDDGGLVVESTYSFFYKVLNSFCMLPSDENFLAAYNESVFELAEAFTKPVFNADEIAQVINKNPEQFAFDCVLVDEAQDWLPAEVSAIRSIFGSNNLVISDGVDQLVRGGKVAWTLGLKEPEKIVFALNKSLRMKSNLAVFANMLAKNLEYIDWSIKINPQIKGGKVVVCVGEVLDCLSFVKKELDHAFTLHNKPVDLLALLSPKLTEKFKNASYVADFEAALGLSIWKGYEDSARRESPKSSDELRVIQYDSSRGMEGWATFCFDFDGFIEYKKAQFTTLFDREAIGDLDREIWVSREVGRWVLMALTRSVDTIFIQIEDSHSEIASSLRLLSEQMPDIVTWKESA
jgi:hypothetical protein